MEKEGQVLISGRLMVLDEQHIVCSCGKDFLAKTAVRRERIGTDDALVKQNRGEKEVHMGQFPCLLLNSGFFEHNACFGFIQIQMMHFPLIWGQMLLWTPCRVLCRNQARTSKQRDRVVLFFQEALREGDKRLPGDLQLEEEETQDGPGVQR